MVGLLVNALVQILSRYANIRLLKSVYAGFAAGLISLVLIETCIYFMLSISGIEFLLILLSNTIIYATLSFCYFNLITLGETARRIRIMVELSESKTGLTLEEIIKRYNARMIVDLRLDRLLGNGEITLRGNRYFIGNSKMLQIGKIYTLAKLILFGKRSEFD
jgi:hypothetical protein